MATISRLAVRFPQDAATLVARAAAASGTTVSAFVIDAAVARAREGPVGGAARQGRLGGAMPGDDNDRLQYVRLIVRMNLLIGRMAATLEMVDDILAEDDWNTPRARRQARALIAKAMGERNKGFGPFPR